MRDRERYESKIICELELAHATLDQLEASAQARRAHAQIVTIHAARELAGHIELRRTALRDAFGFASLRITRDIESAREQLGIWIERLQRILHGQIVS
jgi:hypothetical protein